MQEQMTATATKSVFSGLSNDVAKTEKTMLQAQNLIQKTRVIHGANERYFDNLVGKEIGYVRKALKTAWSVPGDATAVVDGQEVGDDYILRPAQVLSFSKDAGQKG